MALIIPLRVIVVLFMVGLSNSLLLQTKSSRATFTVDTISRSFSIVRENNVTNEVEMGLTIPQGNDGTTCGEGDICVDYGVAKLVVTNQNHCQKVLWTVNDVELLDELKDCVIMDGHWFGGGEQFTQPWPIEGTPRSETPYVTSDMLQKPGEWYGGVTENYWISSQGLALLVDDKVPLFLSLPDEDDDGTADKLCLSAKLSQPFVRLTGSPLELDYTICTAENVRKVHEDTFPLFYGRPQSTPDLRMFREPIWCTWAEYKTDINQTKVEELAYQVVDRGYPYSQFEIDDNWETCYGDAIFSDKFPSPKEMTDKLHALGFRVTLWIHPFINDNCPSFITADENGYLVKNSSGVTQLTSWWQGDSSGIIDFTNPDAVTWWTDRLTNLKQLTGIDSFKFDAGETNWLPDYYSLQADESIWPNIYSTKYVDAVSTFGNLIEVRTGRRNQERPIFFRMLDKNSNWTKQNGLKTLITTLLHFSILGYPFVLPDMIGGNAYAGLPDEELFVRWTQANALMPSLQYSLLPWNFGQTANDVALEVSQLHIHYMPELVKAAEESLSGTTSINRPTWWLCPEEEICLMADQQYLLGDEVLVAPITERGVTSKTVVIPPGVWCSTLDGTAYTGPMEVVLTNLTIKSLPIFVKDTEILKEI